MVDVRTSLHDFEQRTVPMFAGADRVDSRGRDIYILDRDPTVFHHVMEYINTNEIPTGIGEYRTNKELWGLLREEAEYFSLDGLVHLLMIKHSCSPEVKGTGVLCIGWDGRMICT